MANSGSIQAGEFQLRYRIEGTGIPAIVIGSSIYYPRTFSQDLRENLQLIFVDHRGFAPATKALDPSAFVFGLDLLVEDIERVRRALKLDRVVIVGHSGHSYMALEYAKKYPENVSHVVLIGISPSLSAANHQAANQYLVDSVCPERKAVLEKSLLRLPEEIQSAPERRFITYGIRLAARTWYDYQFDPSPLWEGVDVNMQIFDYVWGTVFRDIDISKGLESFDKPVFLGLGRYDFLIAPPSSWDPIRSKFKDLTVRVFERSGHTPQLEEAALFDAELLSWLSLKSA